MTDLLTNPVADPASAERDLLAALGAGTLVLPEQRPDAAARETDPACSPSETVRRHAETFRRQDTAPDAELDSDPDSDPDEARDLARRTPPRRARAVGLAEVGSTRTKRGQTVRLAEAYGWQWTAHALGDPVTSLVVRFRRPGAFPWHHERAVAHWTGSKLPFVAAYAWQVYGGRLDRPRGVEAVPDEPVEGEPVPRGWIVPVSLGLDDLAAHLATPRLL